MSGDDYIDAQRIDAQRIDAVIADVLTRWEQGHSHGAHGAAPRVRKMAASIRRSLNDEGLLLWPVESSRSTPERAVLEAAEALVVGRDALRSYSGPVDGWLRLEAMADLATENVESAARALRAVPSPGDGTAAHECDVTVCHEPAVTCIVGEGGDLWLCAKHAVPAGDGDTVTEQ